LILLLQVLTASERSVLDCQGLGSTETRHLAESRVSSRLDGKWFLDALLGYGGSAAVYGATHRNGKRAAIKVLHPHCVADEGLRTRFVREGYVANKIGHPGAVSVLDDDVADDGTVYLVMELLEGASLERVGRGEAPPLLMTEVVRIADDLLDVLAKAHTIGIVHRDIKPANIFVTKSGELKVLDFGIARLAESSLDGSSSTQTGFMMGTPAFMPPEQARARWAEVDARSDLWSVGATMIALLIARRPRLAETPNEELLLAMTSPLPPVASLVPNIAPQLAAVIDRAVAFDRDDRWPNAAAMQHALRDAVKHSEPRLIVPATLQASAALNMPTNTLVAPTPPRTGPQLPGIAYPPISTVDVDAANHGLTTGRAVLHSARPNQTIRSSTGVISVLLGVALAVAIASVVLYARSRSGYADHKPVTATTLTTATAAATITTAAAAVTAPTTTTAPAATETPPPVATDTIPTDELDPKPTTPKAAPPSTTTSPPKTAVNRPDPKPAKPATPTTARPTTSSSGNPAKYFDNRF
jgi:serine/threonine-protein kinase